MFITLASYHSPDAYVTSTVQNNSIAIHMGTQELQIH
jgi:hypothetical protein